MTRPSLLTWLGLAIAGLVVAVAVAYAASMLASPDVGLSSEPFTSGSRLAPHRRPEPAPHPVRRHPARTTPAPAPVPAPAPAPAPSGDDDGAGGDD